jgi:hypothetical protein
MYNSYKFPFYSGKGEGAALVTTVKSSRDNEVLQASFCVRYACAISGAWFSESQLNK